MNQFPGRHVPAQRLTESGDPIGGGGASLAAGTLEADAHRPASGHGPSGDGATGDGTTGGGTGGRRSDASGSGRHPSETAWRDAFAGPRDGSSAPDRTVNVGHGERVASGAAGVALMGLALRRPTIATLLLGMGGVALLNRGTTGHCAMYARAGVSTAEPAAQRSGAQRSAAGDGSDASSGRKPSRAGTAMSASTTIGRSPDEVYRLWSDPAALKEMLGGLVDVEPAADGHLAWSLPGPLGSRIRWHTRTIVNRPGERMDIAPAHGAFLQGGLSLVLEPAPADRGTIAKLVVRMQPPGGALGARALEMASVVPKAIAGRMLARLKSYAETGEVITTAGQPSGRETTRDDAGSTVIGRRLGMLSLGLGAAGALTPQAFASVMGMPQHAGLFFLAGLRELATGIGLLTADKRAPWAWARVAGDAMDLVVLRSGLHSVRSHRGRVVTALLVIGAITAADVVAAQRLQRKDGR